MEPLQANGILNKITEKTFDALTDQLLKIGIETKRHLVIVLDRLFERALDFHDASKLYARICAKLKTKLEVPDEGENGKAVNFGDLVVQKCETVFGIVTGEDGYKAQIAGGQSLTLSEEQKAAKSKRYLLGFMRFLGECFIAGLVTMPIVTKSVEETLRL